MSSNQNWVLELRKKYEGKITPRTIRDPVVGRRRGKGHRNPCCFCHKRVGDVGHMVQGQETWRFHRSCFEKWARAHGLSSDFEPLDEQK